MSDFKKLTAYEPCGVEYVSVSGTSYVGQLKAENAKLRELVAKYSAVAKYLCELAKYLCEYSRSNECNLDCASAFNGVPSGGDCARMLLDKEARELGVEVD